MFQCLQIVYRLYHIPSLCQYRVYVILLLHELRIIYQPRKRRHQGRCLCWYLYEAVSTNKKQTIRLQTEVFFIFRRNTMQQLHKTTASPSETAPALSQTQAEEWLGGALKHIHPHHDNTDALTAEARVQLCPPPNFGQGRIRAVGEQTFNALKSSEQVPFSD